MPHFSDEPRDDEEHCMNGGTCDWNYVTFEPKCICSKGFTGDKCEVIIVIVAFGEVRIMSTVCYNFEPRVNPE